MIIVLLVGHVLPGTAGGAFLKIFCIWGVGIDVPPAPKRSVERLEEGLDLVPLFGMLEPIVVANGQVVLVQLPVRGKGALSKCRRIELHLDLARSLASNPRQVVGNGPVGLPRLLQLQRFEHVAHEALAVSDVSLSIASDVRHVLHVRVPLHNFITDLLFVPPHIHTHTQELANLAIN